MKRSTWVAAFLAMGLAAASAQAQAPVVLVVDAEDAPVDVARLRVALAEATGRAVVRATDPEVGTAAALVTVSRAHDARWVLRAQRGERVAWAVEDAAGGGLEEVLAARGAQLVGRLDEGWAAVAHDLLDPFRWDPLEVALRAELHHPFGAARYEWAEIVDPFATARAVRVDLLDPWAR